VVCFLLNEGDFAGSRASGKVYTSAELRRIVTASKSIMERKQSSVRRVNACCGGGGLMMAHAKTRGWGALTSCLWV
jgi:hypothetical protein